MSRTLSRLAAQSLGRPRRNAFLLLRPPIAAFYKWLQKKYGSLNALNDAWTRRHPNWEAIDPPRSHGTYADWIDWRRFMIERETGEMKFRVETARSVDPVHVMEAHGAHDPPIVVLVAASTAA